MSHIFWKLLVYRLIWNIWGPSLCILWPVRFFVTLWEWTGSTSWNLSSPRPGGRRPSGLFIALVIQNSVITGMGGGGGEEDGDGDLEAGDCGGRRQRRRKTTIRRCDFHMSQCLIVLWPALNVILANKPPIQHFLLSTIVFSLSPEDGRHAHWEKEDRPIEIDDCYIDDYFVLSKEHRWRLLRENFILYLPIDISYIVVYNL